jgi:putative DNA primase/helicase
MVQRIKREVAAAFGRLGITAEALAAQGIEAEAPPAVQRELLAPEKIIYEYKRIERHWLDLIPKQLKVRPQWCVWRPVVNPGRPKADKPPIDCHTGELAKSNDTRTWSEFITAYTVYLRDPTIYGVGYMTHRDDAFTFIDLDACRDPVTTAVDQLAQDTMADLNSYSEASASLRGVHTALEAKLPFGHRRRNGKSGRLEFYSDSQFIIVSGMHVCGPVEIQQRQAELVSLYEREFGSIDALEEQQPLELADGDFARWRAISDARIVEMLCAREDSRLLFTVGYPEGADMSAEDHKLLCRLAELTGKDGERMETLFGQSAIARPDKWRKRRDYRVRSIQRAISATGKVWEPEEPPTPVSGSTAQEAQEPPVVEDDSDINALILADVGNAARALKVIGKYAMFCRGHKAWYFADKNERWMPDLTGEIYQRVENILRDHWLVTATTMKPADREWKFALASLNYKPLANCVHILEHQQQLAVLPEQLDSDPMLLGVENGIVDLATGTLLKPNLSLLVTKMAAAQFDAEARCLRWDRYLERVQPVPETREFLARLAGALLTGRQIEQCFIFFHGVGANGKSIFLHVLSRILAGYAWKMRRALLFLPDRHSNERATPNDVADLEGKRMLYSSEQVEGRRWDTSFIKDYAGGEEQHGRQLYKPGINFIPTGKILVAANVAIELTEFDVAMQRRFCFVPWNVIIPESERVTPMEEFAQFLLEERAGILNWALAGLRDLIARGWKLDMPEPIKKATQRYVQDEDRVRTFFESDWWDKNFAVLISDEDVDALTTRQLRSRFVAWSEERVSMSTKAFTAQCRRIFGDRCQVKRDRWHVVLGLRMSVTGAQEYAEYAAKMKEQRESKKASADD